MKLTKVSSVYKSYTDWPARLKTGHVNNAQLTTGCFKYGKVLAEARAMQHDIKQHGPRKQGLFFKDLPKPRYSLVIRRRGAEQTVTIIDNK